MSNEKMLQLALWEVEDPVLLYCDPSLAFGTLKLQYVRIYI